MAPGKLAFDRIMVTGASGFVARYLLPELAAAMPEDGRLLRCTRAAPLDAADAIDLDLSDPAAVDSAVAAFRPDLVINLAAQASVGALAGAAGETWATNLGGALHLARAVAAHVPSCTFFQASSAEVYGAAFNAGRATEATVLQPQSSYAGSKVAAERMLADVLPADSPLIVVRPANHSGAGQDVRFVIPAFAAQIASIEAKRSPPSLAVGNLGARRDFTHVSDVIEAYMLLLAQRDRRAHRLTVNIGTGQSILIGDILERLRAMSAVAIDIVQDAARMRPLEVPVAEIDTTLIKTLTAWSPRRTIDEMLRDVIDDQRRKLNESLS